MSLDFYFHPMSQPSRAVLTLLHLLDIKHEKKLVDLMKGEHKAPEFLEINPLGQIPAINDGGFKLWESEAIMKYLINQKKTGDLYYPSDPHSRALVDKFFPWHHAVLRPALAKLFLAYYPVFPKYKLDLETCKKEAEAALKTFEEIYLKDHKYIANDILTIADLSAVNEITQTYLTTDFDYSKFPKVKEYVERCLQNPVLQQVNKPVKDFPEMFAKLTAAAKSKEEEKQ